MSDGCSGDFSPRVGVLARANTSLAQDSAARIRKGLIVKQVCASAL